MSNGILQVLIFDCQVKVITPQGNSRVFMPSEINTILDILHLAHVDHEVIDYSQN